MTATAKSQGSLFTRRALFTLIWPLLLEQTLSVTMGMADTLMVAGVGEAAVSSVSLVDSLNYSDFVRAGYRWCGHCQPVSGPPG